MDEEKDRDKPYDSVEAIAATQQVGDELPSGIRGSPGGGRDMDDPNQTGDIDPDSPDPTNSAAGFSVGGTGAGIERGTDATLGSRDPGASDSEVAASIYDEPTADLDFDPDTDPLGMGTDETDDMITDDR
ncbi:MAG TPA: hypothetical protein VF221_21600 [Chloroflexota bacterium]